MTYKRIAERASVSESTVSKALTGSSEISDGTAARIRRIAREEGYYRDKRILRREHSGEFKPHVALICPEIVSVYYSRMAEEIIEAVAAFGGRTTLKVTRFNEDDVARFFDEASFDPTLDGMISIHAVDDPQKYNIPIVLMTSANHADVNADRVYFESNDSVVSAAEYLVGCGHTSIGFIGERRTVLKEERLRRALALHGITIADAHAVTSNERFFKAGEDCFHRIFDREPPYPTAVVASYDEIAIGFMSAAAACGVRVPEDVSVIGINDIPFCDHSIPALTSVENWRAEMATHAVSLLVKRILGSKSPFEYHDYSVRVVERESVKKLK